VMWTALPARTIHPAADVMTQLGAAARWRFSDFDEAPARQPAAERRPADVLQRCRRTSHGAAHDPGGSHASALRAVARASRGQGRFRPNPSLTTRRPTAHGGGATRRSPLRPELDKLPTTVIDNGIGAATFAARVIIAT